MHYLISTLFGLFLLINRLAALLAMPGFFFAHDAITALRLRASRILVSVLPLMRFPALFAAPRIRLQAAPAAPRVLIAAPPPSADAIVGTCIKTRKPIADSAIS